MVGTGTMLDYETKASYTITVRATDPDNASDTISVTVTVGNVDEQGTVTLNPDRPLVGTALTASLTDPDGGVTGETWRWSRSDAADGTFTGIGGATRASYTPVEADEGMYLKITVTYTDGHGPNKTATASAMVPPPSNSPPRFSETAPTRSIAENSAAGTAVGAPVRATDSDGDSLTYTLGGSDAATFSIGRTSGQLMSQGRPGLRDQTVLLRGGNRSRQQRGQRYHHRRRRRHQRGRAGHGNPEPGQAVGGDGADGLSYRPRRRGDW